MRIFNTVSVLFLAITIFSLGACQTGGGYSIKSWEYSTKQRAAKQPPRLLSKIDVKKEIYAQDYTRNEISAGNVATHNDENTELPLYIPELKAVKVALLLPLSGKQSSLGQSMLKAAQIALFDVGYDNFVLMPKDTLGTPGGAREAARAAIKDGAELILGPVFSDNVRTARQVVQSTSINMIAFSTDWELAGGNTYIMGFLPFDQIQRIIEYSTSQNLYSMGVIAPNTDYGSAVIYAYKAMMARNPLITSEIEIFPARSGNLSPVIRKFTKYDEREVLADIAEKQGIPPEQIPKNLPFDAILMPVGSDLAISISNLLSHYNLPPGKVRRIGTGLFDDLALATEDSLEGSWFAAPSPLLRANFESRFEATYNYKAPRLASLAYDATALSAVLAQRGLKARGRAAFDRSSITNPNGFAGIDGIFRFRSDGTVERGLAVMEFKNGRFIVIDNAPKTFQSYTSF